MSGTLLRIAAWAAATLLAMGMSWLGVHSVFTTDDSVDAPQAIPIAPPTTSSPAPSPELGPPTSTAPPTSTSSPAPSSSSSAAPPPPSSSAPPATESAGDVRAYQLTGGRVVLQMSPTSAKLVSATPDAGWQVQAWQADGWLRVDFSRDGTTSSCFVTWNGHPPQVQTT